MGCGWGLVSFPRYQGIGQEEMASGRAREGLDWILWKILQLKRWLGIEQLPRAAVESPSLEGLKEVM